MGSSPEPDPLRELVDSGFRPGLAWTVRWSDGGRVDPLQAAWASSRDGQLMEIACSRAWRTWARWGVRWFAVREDLHEVLRRRREELRGLVRAQGHGRPGGGFVRYVLRLGEREWWWDVDARLDGGDYGRVAAGRYAIDQVVAEALRAEHPAIVRRFVADPPRLADVLAVDASRAAR